MNYYCHECCNIKVYKDDFDITKCLYCHNPCAIYYETNSEIVWQTTKTAKIGEIIEIEQGIQGILISNVDEDGFAKVKLI